MKRSSFFWKLFIGNMLMMGVILLVAGSLSYQYLNANYQRETQETQRRLAAITQQYFQQLFPKSPEAIDVECKHLFANLPMRLTLVAADGRVLGDSQARPDSMENHKTPDRPEITSALNGQSGQDIRTSETLGSQFRYFAEPIEKDGKIVAAVRVAMPVRAIAEGRDLIRNSLLWAALIAVGVAVIIAGMLSWVWHNPIRQITKTAGQIAAGNLAARAQPGGSDELGQLAGALNEMRQSLANQIATITAQREHLSVIVRNLREGIIALDADGRIVLMNTAARGLLGSDQQDPTNRRLQSVVRIPDVLDIFQRVKQTAAPVDKQIEIETDHGMRIVDLHATNFSGATHDGIEILLVVRDITKIARLAAMKTEFVANASHELRTPLATIRAAVDSLDLIEPTDKDAIAKFTGMLNRHVTRLEEMTKDLLDLNIAETTDSDLNILNIENIEKIDLASLEKWAKNHFSQSAKDKQVVLKVSAADCSETFRSDPVRIKTILQNLIDNAIKFTPAGGWVECDMRISDGKLRIKVSDTGCGIPVEMHDKVFERFFQEERSRSGDARVRGTGLGLAIVKHTTDRLGGNIKLESTSGKGTTITIKIPAVRG